MKKALSPALAANVVDVLNKLTVAPYSSTKSVICRLTPKRLLRVLADGEFYRVGGTTPVKVNVRIIAATHRTLKVW